MAATRVFLDTDVLINWLTKEVEPGTRKALWKASYQILKSQPSGAEGDGSHAGGFLEESQVAYGPAARGQLQRLKNFAQIHCCSGPF